MIQGAQNENSSYVYYTPSYGYAQSQYNPYNPYIHGAMIGPDGPYLGAQQFYTIPSYESSVSSPAYVPVIVQPDIVPNSSIDLIDPSINRSNGNGRMQKNESSGSFSRNASKPALDQRNSLARLSEVPRANVGPSKQSVTLGSISAGSHAGSVSSRVFQVNLIVFPVLKVTCFYLEGIFMVHNSLHGRICLLLLLNTIEMIYSISFAYYVLCTHANFSLLSWLI